MRHRVHRHLSFLAATLLALPCHAAGAGVEGASRFLGRVYRLVAKEDLGMIVSNLGVDPGFSSLFSPNSAMHTGFMQVALSQGHKKSSFAYIGEVKRAVAREMPRAAAAASSERPAK